MKFISSARDNAVVNLEKVALFDINTDGRTITDDLYPVLRIHYSVLASIVNGRAVVMWEDFINFRVTEYDLYPGELRELNEAMCAEVETELKKLVELKLIEIVSNKKACSDFKEILRSSSVEEGLISVLHNCYHNIRLRKEKYDCLLSDK